MGFGIFFLLLSFRVVIEASKPLWFFTTFASNRAGSYRSMILSIFLTLLISVCFLFRHLVLFFLLPPPSPTRAAIGSICSPCASVNGVAHYVPIGTDLCIPCTVSNGTFCVFGGSVLYPDKIYWRQPNGQDIPPQVKRIETRLISIRRIFHSRSRTTKTTGCWVLYRFFKKCTITAIAHHCVRLISALVRPFSSSSVGPVRDRL
jgi:hypothetical protein